MLTTQQPVFRKFWHAVMPLSHLSDGTPKPLHELDADTAAAVAGVEVTALPGQARNGTGRSTVRKYRLADKKSALDALARLLGMYGEQGEQDLADLAARLSRARERERGADKRAPVTPTKTAGKKGRG